VISRIIKVEVSVISRSQQAEADDTYLITLIGLSDDTKSCLLAKSPHFHLLLKKMVVILVEEESSVFPYQAYNKRT